MSTIDELFRDLRASGRKAFMPFVTAGDPDLDFTAALLRELVQAGSNLCEIGIPYSDPIADGPVIQASYSRVLERGFRLRDGFDMIGQVAPRLAAPLVTMVSYTTIYRWGIERYVTAAKAAGVAGAIVPDLPIEQSAPLADACRKHDLSLIQLVTPITSRSRAVRIANCSTGFLYYVTVTGITGERSELPSELVDNVAWLRTQTQLPICVGFGISRPEHIRMLSPVADGLIVGSAIVRRIAAAERASREEVLRDVRSYVTTLIEALPVST
jgi:tryptophan synthase alpha chain